MSTGSNLFYRRPDPPLPDPSKLPFPGNLIRLCQDCGLYKGCRAPVPGENISPHEIMLIGQNPGFQETNWGFIPFCGQAGVYLNSLLYQCSLTRDKVATTNVCHCMSPNNRPLTQAEIKACSHWLELELAIVNPRIVVALGAPAVAHFLGSNAGTMEHLHGKPVEKDGRIILPAYHPAAALRDTAKLRQCLDDFMVLRGLIRGESWQSFHATDEYPNPDYRVADTPAKLKQMRDEIEDAGEVAVDTEICRGKLWSVQFSAHPGTAWFVPIKDDFKGRVDLTGYNATIIVHNYLFDVKYLKIRDDNFRDSMVMAYLTGNVQGLKELASRLCGVPMRNYREVVKFGQQELALRYLNEAVKREWPDPPPIEETKWDNKKGELVTKSKKPWPISRKIAKALADYKANPDTDLWDRWQSVSDLERSVVESVLGAMPESSLSDIPFAEAVAYSSKDSDVTLRVYHKLKKMIELADMDFVLDTDLNILPMVHNMMENGMAVDVEHCRKLSADYDIRMRAKATELAEMVGHPFNPASSKQVAAVVYGELGFKPTKLTPTKEISTDDMELKKTKSPVARGIIQYRGLQKLKTTYADSLVEKAVLDDESVPRIHTTLKTTRVETGRLSSSDPNLQNIPTRNKESKAIKNGFVAPPGWRLAESDYCQIEMVCLAHLSKCKRLIELFLRGGDPHTEMAARIFGVSLEEAAKSKYRYPVKRLNFGVAYLIGAHGLSNQIGEYIADLELEGEAVDIEPWDEPTCEKFLTEWYKLNPEVKDFQSEMVAHARRHGYVVDIFGRRRYVPEVFCPIRSIQEAGARQAANQPVTASAQGIIKSAMGKLWRDLPSTDWSSIRILLQIHDSLLFQIPDEDAFVKECLSWIGKIMTGVVSLRVPVKVDFKIGTRWGDMKKYEL